MCGENKRCSVIAYRSICIVLQYNLWVTENCAVLYCGMCGEYNVCSVITCKSICSVLQYNLWVPENCALLHCSMCAEYRLYSFTNTGPCTVTPSIKPRWSTTVLCTVDVGRVQIVRVRWQLQVHVQWPQCTARMTMHAGLMQNPRIVASLHFVFVLGLSHQPVLQNIWCTVLRSVKRTLKTVCTTPYTHCHILCFQERTLLQTDTVSILIHAVSNRLSKTDHRCFGRDVVGCY